MRFRQLFSWFTKRFSFVVRRGSRFVDIGQRCWAEFEQVARLALQRRADGVEGGEADGAGLSCFENRQVGECDSDSLGQLGQRHATLVKDVVQFDNNRHGHTVASSSSRMRAPCSNTRANTKSRSTASHRVNEKPQLILSGTPADDTLAATAPTT